MQDEAETVRRISDLAQGDTALVVRILLQHLSPKQHASALAEILHGKRPLLPTLQPTDLIRLVLDFLPDCDVGRMSRVCKKLQEQSRILFPHRTLVVRSLKTLAAVPTRFLHACQHADLRQCKLQELDAVLSQLRVSCPALQSIGVPIPIRNPQHPDANSLATSLRAVFSPLRTAFPNVCRMSYSMSHPADGDKSVWACVPKLTTLGCDMFQSDNLVEQLAALHDPNILPPGLCSARFTFVGDPWSSSSRPLVGSCLAMLRQTSPNLKRLQLREIPPVSGVYPSGWACLDKTTTPCLVESIRITNEAFVPGFVLNVSDFPRLSRLQFSARLPAGAADRTPRLGNFLVGSSRSLSTLVVWLDDAFGLTHTFDESVTWMSGLDRVAPCLVHLSLLSTTPGLWQKSTRDSLVDTVLHIFRQCERLQTIQWGTRTTRWGIIHRNRLESDLETFVCTAQGL